MSKKRIYIYIGFSILLLMGWIFTNLPQENNDFPERVKVSLREVGNQLLLSNKDSTSLVLPIIELVNLNRHYLINCVSLKKLRIELIQS